IDSLALEGLERHWSNGQRRHNKQKSNLLATTPSNRPTLSEGEPVLKRCGFLVALMFVGTLAAQQPAQTTPAGGGAAAQQPAGEVEMAWKFKDGEEFFQKLTTTTDQKMKTGNLEVTQKQEQTFVIGWKVLKKTDAEAILEQKILSVAMKITIQGNEIKYDS